MYAATRSQEALELAVERLRQGKDFEESFRTLYAGYRDRLEGFFRSRGLPPEASEDLTQETFLSIYSNVREYRGEAAYFSLWLFQIAGNTFRRHLRSQRAQRRDSSLEVSMAVGFEVQDESTSANPAKKTLRRELWEAVAELPQRQQECLIYFAYHGLSYEEIARVLKISTGTVKAHLSFARNRLKDLLA